MTARRLLVVGIIGLAALGSLATSSLASPSLYEDRRAIPPSEVAGGWSRDVRVCLDGGRDAGGLFAEEFPDVILTVMVETGGPGEVDLDVVTWQQSADVRPQPDRSGAGRRVTEVSYEVAPRIQRWCSDPVTLRLSADGSAFDYVRVTLRAAATFVDDTGEVTVEWMGP